jgi:hypothetical protein
MRRHVRNREQALADCGVATMASIAGIYYEDALELAIRYGTVKRVDNVASKYRGLTVRSMCRMLEGHFGEPWDCDMIDYLGFVSKNVVLREYADDVRLTQCVILISESASQYGHWIACHDHVVYDSNFIVPRPIARYSRDGWLLRRIISPPGGTSRSTAP